MNDHIRPGDQRIDAGPDFPVQFADDAIGGYDHRFDSIRKRVAFNPVGARADAHQRARILRDAASRIMGHTANHTLDRGEAGHFPVAELDARDAAARQEAIGNGQVTS